ncbi:Transposase IS116/IS110/IS902 family protein [Wolbachia endosymbiont of Cylisticus convexus]|uniref:IS110 family transposase n=1 Tax=Wolbachia endosymbiont of Cylisticus convexus TaxID=118728 RepID=UPI000DF68D7E|nr:IS110 family transposase [Wolbachia endosymbiont of Cylisticus convexus]RDD33707.1 Transposase IS116/IS110/IS902 family protein [Wolbachia endosymbiont of Cylisticus convexus]RDD33810.1 Transposase IS116/IS110/IS902 family protein [Wolbachia endosymbiont of Cylisticus convexus]RDD33814.1 Transposase IS116/IS110/IS902 family protein [Wolbachia endosymbiont of Cylisticus convexus]RDD33816.1 Transposase IS116/IS110/IS902 family protein [Wolbachia endosymbiont of Cylisticus convexus]RDD33905.1 
MARTVFMGIDVSKETLDISINNKHQRIENAEKAISEFIKSKIVNVFVELCVVESTGGYEKLVVKLLQEHSIVVHRAHPNRVYAFAKACNHFAKTDKLDAKLLEKYAEFITKNDEVVECIVSQKQEELKELRAIERNLSDDVHANMCRLHNVTGKAREYIVKQIEFAKKQLEQVRQDIEDIIDSDPGLKEKSKLLTSYKGIGRKIASILLIEVPELGRLDNKEIACLIGVAPKTNESGRKVSKAQIIGGRFYARKALYMSAVVAMRHNRKMKALYQRLVASGKAAKVALVAVMRKIIICLNAMVKNNSFYLDA